MVEKATTDIEKPVEILELEREYRLIFTGVTDEESVQMERNAYMLNSKGKVTRLAVSKKDLNDLSAIGILKSLEKLTISANNIKEITLGQDLGFH